jgi:hypothetical protein
VLVDVSVHPDLVTFDGLRLGALVTARFVTNPLSVSVADVTSQAAEAATDGQWSPTVAPLVPGAWECPPDAVLTLAFSHPVDAGRVAQALTLTGANLNSGATITVTASACAGDSTPVDASSARCVAVRPRGLAVGSVAALTLPAGSVYHPLCGALAAPFSQPVTGLVPFRFPFSYTSSPPTYGTVQYRRLQLCLRHGLKASVSLEDVSVRTWSPVCLDS